jgi:ATP-dependent helicase HepA
VRGLRRRADARRRGHTLLTSGAVRSGPGAADHRWRAGDRLTHRFNPGLGPGRIVAVEARTVAVEFPAAGVTLRLAATSDALRPLELRPGGPVRVLATGEEAVVETVRPDGTVRLVGGRDVAAADLWPLELEGRLLERLAAGDVDPVEDFANRLDALHLMARREAGGLGSFLGGRIRLFPHQLHAAERATASDPVRWLLADEVGLGKTVEACLILNHLVRTGRVESCLVVAPETLTVQWLGELWRKHHQVFVLLDEQRLADVARDFGRDFNPFDTHRRAVVGLETLAARPRLTEQAAAAGIDLLVVDEAHHLKRPPGHPGDAAYRAVAPIAALGRHVLLLTATPLEDDAHGFFRLLQLLRPAELPEDEGFEARLLRSEPLPPCTSSTRRAEIGGLPPRVGVAVAPDETGSWDARLALEAAVRAEPAANEAARARKAERLLRALGSGAALKAGLAAGDGALRAAADAADAADPRLDWLAARGRVWKEAGEKTLVFAAHRETLELLRGELSRRAQLKTGVFHEDLTPARRDIEVAQFRQGAGPSLLVSTECGGEGRNFEFCHRLVLFDLPWSPAAVEQRIGRLDRIGRRLPVEIVYFRPPGGIGADVAAAYEAIGLFREPLAGLEPELDHVEAALARAALDSAAALGPDRLAALTEEAGAARTRVRAAAYRELHRDPYRPEAAAALLARVPDDLDDLNDDVVTGACERLGIRVERHAAGSVSIEIGAEALVDHLPGVPGGSSFLGTFDRERAVSNETLDFFAAGHPLVEGVLADLEESARGRVAVLRVAIRGASGLGLIALYKDGPSFEAIALDAAGRSRPEWAAALVRRPLRVRRGALDAAARPGWAESIRALGSRLDPARRPVAVAALAIEG